MTEKSDRKRCRVVPARDPGGGLAYSGLWSFVIDGPSVTPEMWRRRREQQPELTPEMIAALGATEEPKP